MNPKLWIMNAPAYNFGICFAQTYIMLPSHFDFQNGTIFLDLWQESKSVQQAYNIWHFTSWNQNDKTLLYNFFFPPIFRWNFRKPLWDLEPREKAEISPMLHFNLHLLVIFIAPALQPSQRWDVCKQPQCLGSVEHWAASGPSQCHM